jgi:dolichol-phosphate mannosyltransferase
MNKKNNSIAVTIPYYNAANQIEKVINDLPDLIDAIIIINDKSSEPLPYERIREVCNTKTQLVFLENEINLGVGGATKKGFQYAIDHGFDIVIKVDADNQMDTSYLEKMLSPIINGKVKMSKGNRFRDLKSITNMPIIRRIGNLALSFLTKGATGYWHNFDPTNGFIAVKVSVLKKIDFSNLSNRYFFETSLIAELYFTGAKIKDIAMPAIYGDEKSNMKVWKMPIIFLINLIKILFKRIIKKYFLFDFNIGSLYILFGMPLFLFGVFFGLYEWWFYASQNIFAPTGTIMIVSLSIIIGFQLLLQAIQYDIFNAPNQSENE